MSTARLTLRQLQVLHRHGDRSPLLNVFLGSDTHGAVAQEEAQWRARLPADDARIALQSRFQLMHRHPEVTTLQSPPFGSLTALGITQMQARGQALALFCEQEGLSLAVLQADEVLVHCNAFHRTQMSVQALLTGMLSDQGHLTPPVHVLAPHEDMIHTYSVYPEIAKLTNEMQDSSDAIKARDSEMARHKEELMALLPVFRHGKKQFVWMSCFDYFTCREAHELSLIPGTEALAEATQNHIAFRFNQYYSNRRVRSLLTRMLLDYVADEMKKTIKNAPDGKKLVVYSGHDVSILAILHAIDATIVHEEGWWPGYSSALTFELLEDESSGQWFVRARLNGDELALCSVGDSTVSHDEFLAIVADRVDPSP